MNVFEHFSCYTKLPVIINDVQAQVLEQSDTDVIEFHAADIDPGLIPGLLHHFRQDGKKIAHIIFARSMSLDWRRLVCCKELIHILDTDDDAAQSKTAVERLIQQISVPLYLQPIAQRQEIANSTKNDYMGEFLAVTILLPRDAVGLLKPKYDLGEIGSEEIAAMAQIPEPYVRFAFTDAWGELLEKIDE